LHMKIYPHFSVVQKYQIATMSIQCMSCGHVLQIGMKTVCNSENVTNTATLFANQI